MTRGGACRWRGASRARMARWIRRTRPPTAPTSEVHRRSWRRRSAGWEQRLAGLKGAPVVAYHKTTAYLSDWLGFDTIAFLEPKPGIPPNPAHVAQVLGLARQKKARWCSRRTTTRTTTAQLVAVQDSRAARRPPRRHRLPRGQTYLQHMEELVRAGEGPRREGELSHAAHLLLLPCCSRSAAARGTRRGLRGAWSPPCAPRTHRCPPRRGRRLPAAELRLPAAHGARPRCGSPASSCSPAPAAEATASIPPTRRRATRSATTGTATAMTGARDYTSRRRRAGGGAPPPRWRPCPWTPAGPAGARDARGGLRARLRAARDAGVPGALGRHSPAPRGHRARRPRHRRASRASAASGWTSRRRTATSRWRCSTARWTCPRTGRARPAAKLDLTLALTAALFDAVDWSALAQDDRRRGGPQRPGERRGTRGAARSSWPRFTPEAEVTRGDR